jgi:Na+/proline symporter
MEDRQFLWLTRVSVFIMALLATILATYRTNIYELVGESSILGLVTLLAPMTAAIFWSRASRGGALCSMVLGLISYLLMEYYFDSQVSPIIWGFLASSLAMVLGSYLMPSKLKPEQAS